MLFCCIDLNVYYIWLGLVHISAIYALWLHWLSFYLGVCSCSFACWEWEISSLRKTDPTNNLHRVCDIYGCRQHFKIKRHLHWKTEVGLVQILNSYMQFPEISYTGRKGKSIREIFKLRTKKICNIGKNYMGSGHLREVDLYLRILGSICLFSLPEVLQDTRSTGQVTD